MTPPRAPDGERGATLLEVVVALAITAMIAAAATQLSAFGLRSNPDLVLRRRSGREGDEQAQRHGKESRHRLELLRVPVRSPRRS